MTDKNISLNEAIKFHGHLGPYLVLGLLAGELAIQELSANKYFGVKIKVWGATEKPKSCLIDGLQLSTGATYGKGNIEKFKGKAIRILFTNLQTGVSLDLSLRGDLIKKVETLKGHADSEAMARQIYNTRRTTYGAFRIRHL